MPETNAQAEKAFLATYDRRNFDAPLTTVDMAIFSLIDGKVQVLMIRRAQHPALGQWALPGGFIDLEQDQQLADAARRKLEEKTGITTAYLDQVETFGSADRDPRGWSVTILYYALIDAASVELQAHESATQTRWVPVQESQKLDLAFDHQQLLAAAQQRLKAQVEYTALPIHLMPEEFTLSQLPDHSTCNHSGNAQMVIARVISGAGWAILRNMLKNWDDSGDGSNSSIRLDIHSY